MDIYWIRILCVLSGGNVFYVRVESLFFKFELLKQFLGPQSLAASTTGFPSLRRRIIRGSSVTSLVREANLDLFQRNTILTIV